MGTGQYNRSRALKRSRYESYRSGSDADWNDYNEQYTPAGSVGQVPDSRWWATDKGRQLGWGEPLFTDSHGGYYDRSGRPVGTQVNAEQDDISRLEAADAAQQASIDAHSPPGGLFRTGPQDTSPGSFNDALRNEMLKRWYAGVKAAADKKRRDAQLTPEERLTALFEKNYYDPSNDIRAAYGAQEAAINAEADRTLARLNQEHGAAEAGVRAEGANLQTNLAALGKDARTQMNAVGNTIISNYKQAGASSKKEAMALARDARAAGIPPAQLAASTAAERGELRAARMADTTLNNRYKQILGQEINDRKATGNTVTTANIGDLTRILQESRDATSTERLGAIAKLEAGMAGDLAKAKSDKAQAKYSLFIDTLKSGGTLGEAGTKLLTPSERSSALNAGQDGAFDITDVSDQWLGKIDKADQPQTTEGAIVLGKINSAKDPTKEIQRQWRTFQAQPDSYKKANPQVGLFLSAALGYANTYTQGLNNAAGIINQYTGGTGTNVRK